MVKRWDRVKAVFLEAAELQPLARRAYLDRYCAGDPRLKAEVERLLSEMGDGAGSAILSTDRAGAAVPTLPDGSLISGRFRIKRLAGHGGMGEVYEALDEELGGRVALKIIRPELSIDPSFMGRFRREVQIARRVTHPNVCRIFDTGRDESTGRALSYFTMEFVPGETLASRIARRGCLPVADALPLIRQMAEGLTALHEQGIVHRDFKPGNVMLTPGVDGAERAVITDFGLARATAEQDSQPVTRTGLVAGTPDYMSPEQLLGKAATSASDVYALGIVAYEMVTGQRPFRGGETLQNALQRIVERPQEPRRLIPGLPETWNAGILACLEREVEYRPSTPVAAVEALVSSRALPMLRRRRRRWLLAGAGAAAVLAVGLAALPRTSPDRAPRDLSVSAVTTFAGSKDFPAIAPDGKRISFAWIGPVGSESAYQSSRQRTIYVKDVDGGEATPLTNGRFEELLSAWSPDGGRIAFLRREPKGIFLYLIPASGGAEQKICETGVGLSWSPDGKQLALASPPDELGRNHILVRSVETGEQRKVTNPQPASDSFPAFSPDGKTLAFVRSYTFSARELMTVPAGGGPETRLTFDQRAIWGVAWSPNGREILFSANRGGGDNLWRIAARGGTPVRISATPHNAFYPAVAHRAGRLVYTEVYSDSNLYLRQIGGAAQKIVAQSTREDHSPHFSPDGTRIVFVSKRTGSDEIWMAPRDGGQAVQLTHFDGPATGSPRWSPDGRTIAFDTRAHGRAGIYLVSASGGEAKRISARENDERMPAWSGDGAWIYFRRQMGKEAQIWKRNLATGVELQLTRGGGEECVESPGGVLLYFTRPVAGQGIWSVPVNGGEERKVPALAEAGYWRYWGVTRQGLFFLPRTGGVPLAFQLFDPRTQQVRPIARMDKPLVWNVSGASMSADGRWLVASQQDQAVNDILMIDGFR